MSPQKTTQTAHYSLTTINDPWKFPHKMASIFPLSFCFPVHKMHLLGQKRSWKTFPCRFETLPDLLFLKDGLVYAWRCWRKLGKFEVRFLSDLIHREMSWFSWRWTCKILRFQGEDFWRLFQTDLFNLCFGGQSEKGSDFRRELLTAETGLIFHQLRGRL